MARVAPAATRSRNVYTSQYKALREQTVLLEKKLAQRLESEAVTLDERRVFLNTTGCQGENRCLQRYDTALKSGG